MYMGNEKYITNKCKKSKRDNKRKREKERNEENSDKKIERRKKQARNSVSEIKREMIKIQIEISKKGWKQRTQGKTPKLK